MRTPPLDARRALVLDRVRNLTVSALEATAGSSACEGMEALFGPGASAQGAVYCDDLSAWANGCTVIVRLPEPFGGVTHFTYDEHDTRYWAELSTGKRLDLSLRLPHDARSHESMMDMCVRLAREVGLVVESCDEREAAAVSLNQWNTVWALRHALSLLDARERSSYFMMAGLSLDPAVARSVAAVLERADLWEVNLAHVDEIEGVVRAAVQRHNGVELTGKQIQDLSPAEALMSVERRMWDRAADALVMVRYADGLDASFHPVPATAATGRAEIGSSSTYKTAGAFGILAA